jgi:hypothetical protein
LLLSEITTQEVVKKLWEPAQAYAGSAVEKLGENVADLTLAFYPERSLPASLCYIMEKKDFYESWCAGSPATDEDFDTVERKLGLKLPSSYKLFSSIHNGFAKEGNYGCGFSSLERLDYLNGLKDFSWSSGGGSADRLVIFFGDGGGNLRCYHLDMPVNGDDFMTVDWDHETGEIGDPQPFWSFFEDFGKKG